MSSTPQLVDTWWRAVMRALARPPGPVSIVFVAVAAAGTAWISSYPGPHVMAVILVVVGWLAFVGIGVVKVIAAVSAGHPPFSARALVRWSIAVAFPVASFALVASDAPMQWRLRSSEAGARAVIERAHRGDDIGATPRIGRYRALGTFSRNGGVLFRIDAPSILDDWSLAYMPDGLGPPPDCRLEDEPDASPISFSHLTGDWYTWEYIFCPS